MQKSKSRVSPKIRPPRTPSRRHSQARLIPAHGPTGCSGRTPWKLKFEQSTPLKIQRKRSGSAELPTGQQSVLTTRVCKSREKGRTCGGGYMVSFANCHKSALAYKTWKEDLWPS